MFGYKGGNSSNSLFCDWNILQVRSYAKNSLVSSAINHTSFIIRICAFILLVTPSLGLFDCLHHGRLATLDYKYDQIFKTHNDLPLNFSYGAWDPKNDAVFRTDMLVGWPGLAAV